jgi:hypothetical protein
MADKLNDKNILNEINEQAKKGLKVIEESKLVKFVDDMLDKVDNKIRDLQAYLNIAYYAGKQWLVYDENNKRLFEPPRDENEVRYTANRIQPIVRTEYAKITKNKPIMYVVPASSDKEDIKAARVGDKAVEWLYSNLKLKDKNKKLALWGLVTHISFMKPFWNTQRGKLLKSRKKNISVHEGDVDACIVPLFECKWDPSANTWEDVKWFCHMKARDVDEIKDTYGKEVAPEDGLIEANIFDNELKFINANSPVEYNNLENCAVVKEYWEKPSAKYQFGRRITIANGVMLFYEEDIGYGDEDDTERELPFFPYVHIEIPGRIEGQSAVENMIPIQREYNKSRSQILLSNDYNSNPPWLVEEDSLVDDDIILGPGSRIVYHPGTTKPDMAQVRGVGMDVKENIEYCKEEFEFYSGQHEVSHGNTPPGVKSGVAISFLQEQDDTKLGPSYDNFLSCIAGYTSYMLKMIRYMYDEERTIKIVGKNRKIDTISFKGSELTSCDVRMQEGSMLNRTLAAKQEFVFSMIESGVLNPETHRTLILKLLEMGDTDEMYDDVIEDINHAQNENDMWLRGLEPIVREFHNHAIHIQEHNRFRKTSDYMELPPEVMDRVDRHVSVHEDMLIASTGETPIPKQAGIDQKLLEVMLTMGVPYQAIQIFNTVFAGLTEQEQAEFKQADPDEQKATILEFFNQASQGEIPLPQAQAQQPPMMAQQQQIPANTPIDRQPPQA